MWWTAVKNFIADKWLYIVGAGAAILTYLRIRQDGKNEVLLDVEKNNNEFLKEVLESKVNNGTATHAERVEWMRRNGLLRD